MESHSVSTRIARVILLAGPSGSGKSYIARKTRLPVLCLDEFYKDSGDLTLPVVDGIVDWDSPLSWDIDAAMTVITELAHTGRAQTPIYDISSSRRVGTKTFDLEGASLFIAEGIFAADVAAACEATDLLAHAVALRRQRTATFVRRLVRDLAEKRKPPGVLLRRGMRLWRQDSAVLNRQRSLGCRPMSAAGFLRQVEGSLATAASGELTSAWRTPA